MSTATEDPVGFIEANTSVRRLSLCPEIRLRLVAPETALWPATEDLDTVEVPQPYWAICWAGGQALARFLLDHPDLVRGKRVLDFGAGSGIAGIAAARAGAAEVLASDLDPLALVAIGLNASLNEVRIETTEVDLIYTANPGWDVILAAEILYDCRNSNHGLRWMRTLVDAGTVALIADPGRRALPSRGVEELARFPVRSVPDVDHPDLHETLVLRLTPNTASA